MFSAAITDFRKPKTEVSILVAGLTVLRRRARFKERGAPLFGTLTQGNGGYRLVGVTLGGTK